MVQEKGREIMVEFKNILFPVDLSESSGKILPAVRTVAERFQATVHLLFVVHDLVSIVGLYVPHPPLDSYVDELKSGAKVKLEDFYQEKLSDMPTVKHSIVIGDPAEEIVKYAIENCIDLIIMGTHGRKGLDRLFFGSVAEKVVKMSPVPVLTVNPHKHL
jgi:nucleotide-binding universal stress UspA family protein